MVDIINKKYKESFRLFSIIYFMFAFCVKKNKIIILYSKFKKCYTAFVALRNKFAVCFYVITFSLSGMNKLRKL